MEECVSDTVHHVKDIFVGMRDVPIRYSKEEFVPDTEHRGQKSNAVFDAIMERMSMCQARNQEEMCRNEGCTINIET